MAFDMMPALQETNNCQLWLNKLYYCSLNLVFSACQLDNYTPHDLFSCSGKAMSHHQISSNRGGSYMRFHRRLGGSAVDAPVIGQSDNKKV